MLQPALLLTLSCTAVVAPAGNELTVSAGDPPFWTSALLLAPPLVGRPTADAVSMSVVGGVVPTHIELRVEGVEAPLLLELAARQTQVIAIDELSPGREYTYVLDVRAGDETEQHHGRFVTARPRGTPFAFAVFSDPHLPVPDPRWFESTEYDEQILAYRQFHHEVGTTFRRTTDSIRANASDFVICLGDMLHLPFGFNGSFTDGPAAQLAYLDFRRHLGRMGAEAAFFAVIGNWEGENGWHRRDARRFARRARMRLLVNPQPETYRFGGGRNQDYYAWEWGDAFFCVLNVMSYTTTRHTMQGQDAGTPEDWTLGGPQTTWFEDVLARSDQPYKFVFIHHAVGGRGGDAENSAYGRGGGRAARIGEQARVHELMLQHGVQIFFHGHDHVFTDMVVDGIHYTLPGSAGAPWKFPEAETGYTDFDERSGYATVRVGAAVSTVEFRDVDGEVFKSFDVLPNAPTRD